MAEANEDKVRTILQNMVKDIDFANLPPTWNFSEKYLTNFSDKKLWNYQKDAIKNAIKVLWKYYQDFVDYQEGENLEGNQERKRKLFEWYKNNGLDKNQVNINLKDKKSAYDLLKDYYSITNDNISYEHFINRMSFWMATGSGKSIVIVKLIQTLLELIKRKEIPAYDILFLTHRDDLIEQFKRHIKEFNQYNETKIELKELKEYPEVKSNRQNLLFGNVVFYYRSDNLSDEQKEKIIDFKNYDNDGRWYVILDEAHKGDKSESKRQHIYSILSRNGFLFNFSATFTDPRDIITTAFEFNLSSFIEGGYGKHISILQQEMRAFKDNEDYTGEEKQKIVLKSLILLTYVKKFYEKVKNIKPDLYHNPMLLVLVNSVNTEDADLKLFFKEIEKIGKRDISNDVFQQSIKELLEELKNEPEFMFENGEKLKIDKETLETLKNITIDEILSYVFNSQKGGEIEVLLRPSNKKELAFKLKTSDKPFALIKIGDISNWLKENLDGYDIQERFEDESFFESLNREDSEINILMGSRGFYEGWDSNRPNVLCFINIGVGEESRKFILQSVGRGVRIEPIKNKRKRLLNLYNSREVDEKLFNDIKNFVIPLETLFIFGTNRDTLINVIQELKKQKTREKEHKISLSKNEEAIKGKILLVPVYKKVENPNIDKIRAKYEISREDFEVLKSFVSQLDDRVLIMKYDIEPFQIKILREKVSKEENFKINGKSIKNIDILMERFLGYLNIISEEFEKFKELENEIKHFENIKVYLEDIRDLEKKIESVSKFKDPDILTRELKDKLNRNEIDLDQYTEEIKKISKMSPEDTFTHDNKTLIIKHIANHYYIPILLSDNEKIDYIKHIIKTKSEVEFIKNLESYLNNEDNKFNQFDWWLFSKLDESLDDVYIPYYEPNENMIRKFKPDFIFWLKKGDNYFIVFVDPKSEEYTKAERKIDGYEEIFTDNGQEKTYKYNNDFNVKVKLFLIGNTTSSKKYVQYWCNNIDDIVNKICY